MSETATAGPAAPAATHGAGHHWGVERFAAAAALALFVWLAVSLWRLPGFDYQSVTHWLAHPLAAVPMLLFIAATFWHAKMGLIVAVEDYVHEEGGKLIWVALIKFACIFAAALAAFCVLKIALGGGAG